MARTWSSHGNSMNNLLSYCGLVDARISASDKDLPVQSCKAIQNIQMMLMIVKDS